MTSPKRVLVLQHVAVETLGAIEPALAEAGIGHRYVRPFLGETVPTHLDDVDGLIVLGGPMGVYDEKIYPHLRDELKLIETALAAEKPLLGICLGSQLLAHTLGAKVYPGPRKEIGWYPVTMEEEAKFDPLWHDAPATFTACHWHGDVFDLPHGAKLLARSDMTSHQAFRFGKNAYGTLFHVETTEPLLANMIAEFADELRGAGLSGEQIAAEAPSHWSELKRIGRSVFDHWAALVKKTL